MGDSRGPAFIGLTDQLQEAGKLMVDGSAEWVANGCTSKFRKWTNPEHGGAKDPNIEDCATMPPWHEMDSSYWNDEKCQCSRGCLCEHGMSTKPEYGVKSLNRSSSKPDIECRGEFGLGSLVIILAAAVGICCVIGLSFCICYRLSCCCWNKSSAQAAPHPQTSVSMVLGQPVQGQVIEVGSK